MKANEAPKKIYIDANEDWLRTYTTFTEKAKGNDIKYIRADAFIEKACDAYCKVCGHYAHTTPNYICRQACDYFMKFKKYLKGE